MLLVNTQPHWPDTPITSPPLCVNKLAGGVELRLWVLPASELFSIVSNNSIKVSQLYLSVRYEIYFDPSINCGSALARGTVSLLTKSSLYTSTMVLASHPNPTAPVISHFNLTGKVALVTGGCRGIGLEVARGLAEAGANVAITYTSQKPADADAIAASLAASTGRAVKALKCEVKSRDEVFETVEKVVADKELSPTGRLHVVVANAGTAGNVPALDHPEDRWREMLDINFHGAFWTAQAAAQVFERQWRADGGKEGGAQSRCSIMCDEFPVRLQGLWEARS